jgi:glycosyltransferase involved in cell wall biosynthesis
MPSYKDCKNYDLRKGKKIKILFMIGSYGTGGKERQLAELIKCLPGEEFKIHLLVKETGANYLESFKDKFDSFYSLNRKRFGLKSFFLIYKYINKVKPDVVHSWGNATSIFSILVRFISPHKFKTIDGSIRHSSAQFDFFSVSGFERLFISKFSDLIIANSKAGLESYHSPKRKSLFIYNGFDLNRIAYLESIESVRLKYKISTKYVVTMVATFDYRKDWKTYITTAQSLLRQRSDLTFIAVGEGQMFKEIKNNVRPEYIEKIIFTGRLSNVESIVNCCDIGILTSTYNGEGISNSILEYMALKKPVIATKGGGTEELVTDLVTGFLIMPYNPKELEEKINFLLENNTFREEMGLNGYKTIQRDFNIPKMNRAFQTVYKKLIQ